MKSVEPFNQISELSPAAAGSDAHKDLKAGKDARKEGDKFDAMLAQHTAAVPAQAADKLPQKGTKPQQGQSATTPVQDVSAAASTSNVSAPGTQVSSNKVETEQSSIALPSAPRSIHDSITRTTRGLTPRNEATVKPRGLRSPLPLALTGSAEPDSSATPTEPATDPLALAADATQELGLNDDLDDHDPAALQAVLGQLATIVARIVAPPQAAPTRVASATAAVPATVQVVGSAAPAATPVTPGAGVSTAVSQAAADTNTSRDGLPLMAGRRAPAALGHPLAQTVAEGPAAKAAVAAQALASTPTTMQTVPAQSVPSQAAPVQSMPTQSVTTQSVTAQSVPTQSVPTQSVPTRAVSAQAVSAQSNPTQAVSAQSVATQSNPTQTVPAQPALTQAVPAQSVPAQSAPVRSIPGAQPAPNATPNGASASPANPVAAQLAASLQNTSSSAASPESAARASNITAAAPAAASASTAAAKASASAEPDSVAAKLVSPANQPLPSSAGAAPPSATLGQATDVASNTVSAPQPGSDPTQRRAAPADVQTATPGQKPALASTQSADTQLAGPTTQLEPGELRAVSVAESADAVDKRGTVSDERDLRGPSRAGSETMDRVNGFTRGALLGSAISAYSGRTQQSGEQNASARGQSLDERDGADDDDKLSSVSAFGQMLLSNEQAANVQQLQQAAPLEAQRFDVPTPPPAVPVPAALPVPQAAEVVFAARPPGAQTEAASISIHHPDLGPIQLEVHRDHGRVEVHAVIESVHAEAVLRANESGIRQGVQQSGMTFSALRVRVRGEEQPTARPAQARRRRPNEAEK